MTCALLMAGSFLIGGAIGVMALFWGSATSDERKEIRNHWTGEDD